MKKRKIVFTVVLLISLTKLSGQSDYESALNYWQNGEVLKAHNELVKIVNTSPGNEEAKYLLMKSFFIQGRYNEALEIFTKLNENFEKHSESVDLAIQAYIHLRDYNNAYLLAKQNDSKQLSYLEVLKNKRFTVIADRIYRVQFLHDDKISSDIWPGVTGRINGVQSLIRFDTGADYMIVGLTAAQKLGIELENETSGMHATSKISMWNSIIDSMSFDNGPSFLNVPVKVMADLGEHIIFGTNILEQLFTTIDYPNKLFIFTPRNNVQLIKEHHKLLSPNSINVPFFLWSDHYMTAKGKFGSNDGLNLFFDSGLIALTQIDGKVVQASFTASLESLIKWGFDKTNLNSSCFIPTDFSLSINNLVQPNTLVWYDANLKNDRNFGGIRIDGLISHSWLKNYSWTIDFDRMEYIFGM